MSRRIYFLVPDLNSCHSICDELEEIKITKRHLHVIASSRYSLDDLPEANSFQTSDLAHGLEWGVGIGGTAGLLSGLLAVTFPPAGLILGGQAILAGVLAGASFGGIVSGLVAADQPNHNLEAFEENIARGELLVLVDVPKIRVDDIKNIILKHHPEAHIGVTTKPEQ